MLATWGTSTGFNPASLFAGGEQGAWYDPSDNPTMFQESTGITPVTAVEQAVGLILDKSKGLVLGPELFSNQAGTFLNTTGGATTTYTSATQTVSVTVAGSNSEFPRLQIDVGMTVGRTYLVSGRIDGTRTGLSRVRLATSGTANDLSYNSATGVIQGRVVAAASTVEFLWNGTVTGDRNIATLSVRELAGNHAFQSTSASRPTLRARYNLLTYSEQFDNAAWTKFAAGAAVAPVVTANAGTAPDGTTTADRIQFDCGNAGSSANRSYISPLAGNPITSGVSYIASVYVKAFDAGNVGRQIRFAVDSLNNGVFTLTADWQRITLTATATATITSNFIIETRGTFTQQTADVLVWGAQFIQTNVFPSNVYQRIAAATDYATGAAFPQYLAFDGTDDSLLTGSINFSATDKMTVFAAVTKLSDAALSMLVELSASSAVNPGAFYFLAPNGAATAGYQFRSGGSANANVDSTSTFAAPITNVLTGIGDISGDISQIRVDGALNNTNTGDQGTGNFGNYPLFIGRRNNSSLPFNGRIYSLIVRGAQSNSTQIAQTERWVAAKTPLGTL